MKDKKTGVLLVLAIICIIILLAGVIFLAYLNEQEETKTPTGNKGEISTRRTIKTTNNTVNPTNAIKVEESTTNSTTTEAITTEKTTIKNTTSKGTNVTTKKTTSKKTTTNKTTTKKTTTTKKIISVIPERPDRETTEESTTYPNALDNQEWMIVDLINEERIKNGLEPLGVSPFLRNLAEEAADFWYEYSDSEIKDYLYGYSNYRRKSNHLIFDYAHQSLYQAAKENTRITTDESLRYVGVGVIYREKGMSDLPTHYFVVIYE